MSLPTRSPQTHRGFQHRLFLLFALGLFVAIVVGQRFALLTRTVHASAFTSGNLVVYRVGDGTAALGSAATAVFLDEYTTSGALVQSIAMPTVVNVSNKRLTASGTATSEGLMTRSSDGKYLTAVGYDAALGTGSITTSASATINRVIARVDSSGVVDTTTALSDGSTGSNPRSATSTNGTDLWMDGGAGGIRYTTLGSTTSTQLSTTVTNLRQTNIFAGQLYVSSASGAFRLATVGTGTPTTSGQTITNLPGFPTATGSPYGFFFADLDAGVPGVDTVYVADDGGTIQKYSLVSGSWAANGTKALATVRGITGVVNGSNVTLYLTNGPSIQTLTDTSGYNATINGTVASVAAAPTNTAFRGVAFAPVNPAASPSPTPSVSPTPSPSPTPTPTPSLSINDVTHIEGNSGTTAFTFTVSLSLPADVGGVNFTVNTADGTATLADNDYVQILNGSGSIAQGNTSTTVTVLVNGDTNIEPTETFFVNITNVTGAGVTDGQGQGNIINDDGVGSPGVVISQIYGGGGNSGSTYKNDFIELYNRGATPVDLSGWSVQDTGATNAFAALSAQNTPLVTNLSGIIQPGHYFLIQEAAGAGGTTDLPTPDLTGQIAIGSTAGKVALVNNTTVLSGNCPDFVSNGIIDFVGYGPTADCSETSPTAVLSNTTAAIRNQNGCQDVNNNSLDFSVSSPIPRNSSNINNCAAAGTLSASGSANPSSLDPGGSSLLTVTVTPASGPTSTGITVTGNLSSIGGSTTQQFYDDGTHGDVTPGDNVFSFFATTPANATTGAKPIPFNVADAQARNAAGTITLSLTSPTCGVERWSVKVGTDPDAGLVDLTKATPVTIGAMRLWTAPGSPPLNARVQPYETTAWVINGTLIDYKEENDVDYHIVVQDGAGNTVITEIPCPCCGIGSPFEPRMAVARQTFDSTLQAQTFFQNPNIPVRITGVGFFDFLHGQTGVAPNGIEIHTILDISFPTAHTTSTGTGSNVTIQAGDVNIHFGNVSAPGSTTSTPIDPSTAGPALPNYSLVGPAFDVTTTASTTGPYGVCISVPYITDPASFANLKLLHREGSALVDRTTGENFQSKTICGSAPTLSPFVVALGPTPTASNGNISGRILDNSGQPVAGAAVRMSGAQDRLVVTDSNGSYNFDNVETNGLYTIVPSRANYAFSPAQRSFSQLGQHTDAVFTATSTGGALNPLDRTEYFVRQQYLDFLGREPDEPGLNFWVNNIEGCGSDAVCREAKRTDTSAAFFLSIEFQQTGYEVYRLYRAAYGTIQNAPVPVRLSDFKADSALISEGVVVNSSGWEQLLENNRRDFAAAFVQRTRFATAYPNSLTPDQFTDRLFATAGVLPSPVERAAVISEFGPAFDTSDVAARGRALRRVAETPALGQQEFDRAFVLMQYFGYLGRDPDAAPDKNFDGYNFWLGKLDGFGGNYLNAEMVKAFVLSTEYRGRFPR